MWHLWRLPRCTTAGCGLGSSSLLISWAIFRQPKPKCRSGCVSAAVFSAAAFLWLCKPRVCQHSRAPGLDPFCGWEPLVAFAERGEEFWGCRGAKGHRNLCSSLTPWIDQQSLCSEGMHNSPVSVPGKAESPSWLFLELKPLDHSQALFPNTLCSSGDGLSVSRDRRTEGTDCSCSSRESQNLWWLRSNSQQGCSLSCSQGGGPSQSKKSLDLTLILPVPLFTLT